MKRTLFSRLVALFLVVSFVLTGTAQPPPSLPSGAAAIKRKAETLSPHARISVILFKGEEQFGEFLSSHEDTFTFHDVDRNADVTLKYTEVRKLKIGYGGYNYARGRHTDRTRNWVVAAVVLGALGGLIGAVAASRN